MRALPDGLLDRFRVGSGLLGTGRLGEPEEIAGARRPLLASPGGGLHHGQWMVVDGGGDLLQVSLGSTGPV